MFLSLLRKIFSSLELPPKPTVKAPNKTRPISEPSFILAEANVCDNWNQTDIWRSWEPPLDLVRGESYRQNNIMKFAGKPRKNGWLVPVPVTIVREPENKHDKNALRVEIEGIHVGYIAKEVAAKISPVMDKAGLRSFKVAGLIRGGNFSAPTLGVHIWLTKRLTPGPDIQCGSQFLQQYSAPWPPRNNEGKEEEKATSDLDFESLEFPPRSKSDKPGYYNGKYYTEYVELVKILKRAGYLDKAETLLLRLIEAVESESAHKNWGVAPWYYEQLAIIYRKTKKPEKESEILERFAHQKIGPGVASQKLLERLEKVRTRLNKDTGK